MAAPVLIETEDAKMNMTPMIDMTFLLVVFFMLTIDLSQKEFFPVELPIASMGNEDKEDPKAEVKRFTVNLTGDGKVIFRDREFDLSSEDPGDADDAIQNLQDALRGLIGNDPDLREEDGASKVPIMINADRGAKWKYVQWVMQACAHKDIKVYKLQFSVKKLPEEDEK